MKKYATYTNSDYSGWSSNNPNTNARYKIYPFNSTVNSRHNQTSDLQKLSSRIMCSANITRQCLNQRPSTSATSDDDEEFFQNLKSVIDKDLSLHSKENYKPNSNYQDTTLLKKKRSIIDEETQSVIKRFKKDTNHNNFIQSLSNRSNAQSNYVVENVIRTMHNESTNTVAGTMGQENMFTPNMLNAKFRNLPNKYVLQLNSKLQQNNALSLHANEASNTHTEYEEYMFYEMTFLTPPNSYSNEDNRDF